MQELAKAITAFRESESPSELEREEEDASTRPCHEKDLRKAAEAWAMFSLRTFRDDLLRKGLAVSAAVADFLAELEKSLP